MNGTRVILADDNGVVRAGIKKILLRASDIYVIGEASNGIEALQLVDLLQPDVLLLDLEMPVMDGLEVTRRLHVQSSPVRILVLSANNDEQLVKELFACGAAGYLAKDEAPTAVIAAVRGMAISQLSLPV